jgi:Zinc finger C-x8-C-x5-C-x3-H type (and similar)
MPHFTFSNLKSFDESAPAILASAWKHGASTLSREKISFDLDTCVGFLFVDPTSSIRFVAVPKQVGYDPTPPIIGNMGDSTDVLSPCSFTTWNETFIALVTTNDVTKFLLSEGTACPYLTTSPVTTENPTPEQAVHAPIQHPGEALRFAILPIFLPVPYGVLIPSGNFAANTLDSSFSDTDYPFGRIWMTAMAHIHSTNAGKPFHLYSGLFQADTVIGTPTPDGPNDFSEYTLATNLSPSISTLQVWDPLYKVALDHCRKCLPLTTTIETPVPTSLPSPPSTDPDLLAVLVKALTKTISSPDNDTPRATLTEQGNKAESAIAQLKYRLLFSCISEDNTINHPSLNPAFTECISAATAHASTRMFIENLADFTREHQTPTMMSDKSFNPLWSYVNLDMTYDKYLATVILKADWFQGHPDTDKTGPSKSASIFAFCAPDTASIEFQLRTASGLCDNAEHVAGEHASKRQKTTTDILLVNKQHEQPDPLSCIANTYSVLRFMVDPSTSDSCQHTTPVIIRILLAFGNLFREPQFVRWVNYYLIAYPWLPHSLIMELHSALRPIFQLLSYQGYRRAIAENNPIDVKVFQDPWDSASATINQLRGCIFSNKLNHYSFRPTSYGSSVCPLRKQKSEQTPSSQQPTKTAPPKKTSDPKKSNAKDNTPNANSSPGILIFTRDGNPPPYCKTIYSKLPNGNLARLCSNFLMQGISCKNGTNCPFVHLSKIGELDKANRALFNTWVKDTPSIKFPPITPTPAGNTTLPQQTMFSP